MTKKQDDDFCHPSVDTTNRCSNDYMLRKHGFAIHSRKKNQEAEWIKDGRTWKESVLLDMIEQTGKSF